MSERPRPGSRPRPAGPAPRQEPPVGELPAQGPLATGRPKVPVGRGIRKDPAGEELAQTSTEPGGAPPTGELSPFQRFGGAGPAAAHSATETVQVVGMVIGLVMTAGAAALAMLVVFFFVAVKGTGLLDGPAVSPEKRPTVDTDVQIAGPRAQPKPSAPRGKAEEIVAPEPDGPAPAREVSGTILFDLKPGELFHTIEAKCPSTPNVRRRAEVRGSRGTITLPDNEDCKLTFQGSLPAYGYLRGGQTKTCTFNPTHCR